jgi:hypothetical protein
VVSVVANVCAVRWCTVQSINGHASTMSVLFAFVLTGMKRIKNIVAIGTILVKAM